MERIQEDILFSTLKLNKTLWKYSGYYSDFQVYMLLSKHFLMKLQKRLESRTIEDNKYLQLKNINKYLEL